MTKELIYAKAANGMEVRIPADKYLQWSKAQEEIRSGKRKPNQQIAKQIASNMEKE